MNKITNLLEIFKKFKNCPNTKKYNIPISNRNEEFFNIDSLCDENDIVFAYDDNKIICIDEIDIQNRLKNINELLCNNNYVSSIYLTDFPIAFEIYSHTSHVHTVTGEPYFIIKITHVKFVSIKKQNIDNKSEIYIEKKYYNTTILGNGINNCMVTNSNSKNNRPAIAGREELFKLDSPLFNIMCEINPFMKDIFNCNLNGLPFTYNKLFKSYNKRDFFIKNYTNFNVELFNPNKYTFHNSYYLFKLSKLVSNNEFLKLKDFFKKNSIDTEHKFSLEYVLVKYFIKKNSIDLKEDEYIQLNVMSDIIKMSKQLKVKIELKCKSLNGLRKYHDSLVNIIMEKDFNSTRNKLKIDKKYNDAIKLLKNNCNFRVILSRKELYNEAKHQGNCVYTYLNDIQSGKCIILMYYTNCDSKEHYTVELGLRKKRNSCTFNYVVKQIEGRYTAKPTRETVKAITSNIDKLNKQITIN